MDNNLFGLYSNSMEFAATKKTIAITLSPKKDNTHTMTHLFLYMYTGLVLGVAGMPLQNF